MTTDRESCGEVEKAFLMLPPAEREAVISRGVVLRLSDLRKRLFLAKSKIRHFEEKYNTTLDKVESLGLPDDADHLMHEDYVMWRHWIGVADKAKADVVLLEKVAEHGLRPVESLNAGH